MQKYIDFRNNIDLEKLKEPAQIIKDGGIVIFPTETVYGIGTNGFNEKSIRKIYELKKRDSNKPISLLVSNMEMVKMVAQNITELERTLMEQFWPGPFTIILKKKKVVPDILTANGDTVGVRMPSGIIAKQLIEYAGVPIATPSANISGKPSGTNMDYIKNDFEGKVDYIIDSGISELGVASTIVKVENKKPIILREGSIKTDEIFDFVNNYNKRKD